MESQPESGGTPTRVRIAAAVTSSLGIVFGMSVIVLGSFLTWRCDRALGLFNQSGLQFANLISGDGKISLVLGSAGVVSLLLGMLLLHRVFYTVAIAISVAALLLATYETIYLVTRPGITGPGLGIQLLYGGGVAAFFCSLCGYHLLEKRSETH